MIDIENLYLQIYLLLTQGVGPVDISTLRIAWGWFSGISTVVSILLVTAIIYTSIRTSQMFAVDQERLKEAKQQRGVFATPDTSSLEPARGERWQRALSLAETDDPNSWRLAILEADVLLDEILRKRGYQGESIGERLKAIDQSELQTLEQAWEAHKVRNSIAHEGSQYQITKREAQRVIDLYRQVFEELEFLG
jgi:hypothetical protein